ncbi:MAG: transcriptional repressor [Pseudomonadota bacterium]
MARPPTLADRAQANGVKMTHQRRLICDALEASDDHPDVDALHVRARKNDPKLSLSSVYRTLRALETMDMISRHDFGDGRARFEIKDDRHHDHLIDTTTGRVIEFLDPKLEALKNEIAARLGYELQSHRLELYGQPRKRSSGANTAG